MAETINVKTTSENTIKAYNLLKENGGDMTYKEIATELGFESHAKILGGINSLRKKGAVLDGEDKTVGDKVSKTVRVNPEVEVVFEKAAAGEKGKVSEKGMALLAFFKGKGLGVELTAQEIAEEMGIAPIAVYGVAKRLINDGLLQKSVVTVEVGEDEKEMKVLEITEAGMSFEQ